MTPTSYAFLQDFLKRRSGLSLGDGKQYLIDNRLKPIARKAGFADIDALMSAIRAGNSEFETAVVEAMMTNESFFFRDKTPFDHLRDSVVPALSSARAGAKQLRFWCAAASTGQEPYSIAMLLADLTPSLARWKLEIVGTDLCQGVLDKAKSGIYSQFEVQRGLPVQSLVEHFEQTGNLWKLKDRIRAMVDFRRQNLLDPLSGLGMFDVIFCRNVLIYFDMESKRDVLHRLSNQLADDGYLVLGAAETVVGLSDGLEPIPGMRGIYRRKTPASEVVPFRRAS